MLNIDVGFNEGTSAAAWLESLSGVAFLISVGD